MDYYDNGKEYYAMQGHGFAIITGNIKDRPSKEFIKWHNENVFLGLKSKNNKLN